MLPDTDVESDGNRKTNWSELRRGRRTVSRQKAIKELSTYYYHHCSQSIIMDTKHLSLFLGVSLSSWICFVNSLSLSLCANCQTKTDVSVELLFPISVVAVQYEYSTSTMLCSNFTKHYESNIQKNNTSLILFVKL